MNIFHKSQDISKPTSDVHELMDRIKAHVKKYRVDVKDIYRDFDRLRSGKITKAKFFTGLELCNIKLSPSDLKMLENRFEDEELADKINVGRFIDEVDQVFVVKNLHRNPTAEAKTYEVKTKPFTLGVLPTEQMHTLNILMEQVAMLTQKNRVKMRRFFKDNDNGVKGRVKQSEFRSILALLNINLTDKDLALITQRFGIAHFGTKLDINYMAFCDEVEALEVRKTTQFQALLERMRKQLRKRGARGIHGLAIMFRRMDSYDRNRKLDKKEFIEGLEAFGVKVSKNEAQQLMKAYDRNNDGVVSYDEFIRGMRGSLNSRRLKMVMKAFKKLDENGNECIEVDDLKGKFNAKHHPRVVSGEMKERDALEIFLNSFEDPSQKDGKVHLDEFEDYYANISASIDDDEYFVRMMEKVWDIEEYEYES
mmetsp:Transcript_2324/g.3335  ORF Transcript_2324/g.3335 Transcript_2324/m.3335 type:complete len:423 (-) Transcript_2324:34-1302(-)|eukprot:CAMPEP_0184482512 /NCGR_PEP_ID=MMETSP0113_2-20130426/4075_1 /TAXON_ID=91329 /ORGANISM="Norrisiella sphaerica, Strain BC52" /LENGTH=422 /DNA_ID=CAMNT_0026862287 /DNA_START=99 /DNA_END=1367 /DNA_ORIENTATION=+